ncbi:MAG: glutamate racemase [Pseudomonadota bacterium]
MSDSTVLVDKKHADSHFAVGVFDSGIGGLSVLKHLREQLPHESFLYVADSAFAPYGERTVEELIARSIEITDFLLQQSIKALVIACNTATAAAVKVLRQRYPDLIIIGMEPGLKPAALKSLRKIVGVLATRSTLQSEKFNLLREQLTHETQVQFIPQACVGLVDQIEKGELESSKTMQLVRSYVAPLLAQGADTLVLGCTHYPFVADLIKKVIQENSAEPVQLIDTGEAVARQLKRVLEQGQLLKVASSSDTTTIHAWTTGGASTLHHAFAHMLELPEQQFTVNAIT